MAAETRRDLLSDASALPHPFRFLTFRSSSSSSSSPLSVNLLPDLNYIMAFHSAGFNNQVLVQLNLLYLAFLARHNYPSPTPYTPILPPFFPHFRHLGGAASNGPDFAPVFRFSQVFDLDRLAHEIKMGIVEFSELKNGSTGMDPDYHLGIIEDEWATEDERRETKKKLGAEKVRRSGFTSLNFRADLSSVFSNPVRRHVRDARQGQGDGQWQGETRRAGLLVDRNVPQQGQRSRGTRSLGVLQHP